SNHEPAARRGITRIGEADARAPPRRPFRLSVDLDIAPDQSARPVRVSRSLDAKFVHSPGLAAVIDLNGQQFSGRACRAGDLGRASERRVRVRTTSPGADE